MEPTLTLYDLASVSGAPFSPKTWQISAELPFKTVWLPLVDIKPTLQPIGALPTLFPAKPDFEGIYTVPVLVDASSSEPPVVISHSLPIAEYLDEKYPDRPLFPPGSKALLELYDKYLSENIFPSFPLLIPQTLPFLVECDKAYFRDTRERWFERTLEDMGTKREKQLETLREALNALAGLLDKNGDEKVLVLGDQVSKEDFVLIGLFAWLVNLDPSGCDRVKTWNGGRWEKLWDLSEVWRLNQA